MESARAEEITALSQVAEKMVEAARRSDPEQFFQRDLTFHETLWNLSYNIFLPRLLEQALAPLLAFLFIRNVRRNPGIDMMASAQAHVDMAQALLSGDKTLARRVALEKLTMFADQHMALYE